MISDVDYLVSVFICTISSTNNGIVNKNIMTMNMRYDVALFKYSFVNNKHFWFDANRFFRFIHKTATQSFVTICNNIPNHITAIWNNEPFLDRWFIRITKERLYIFFVFSPSDAMRGWRPRIFKPLTTSIFIDGCIFVFQPSSDSVTALIAAATSLSKSTRLNLEPSTPIVIWS